MILQKDQFPLTIQAYEMKGNVELFIAEQVVSNQAEVDTFSNKYAGKLIKAKAYSPSHAHTNSGNSTSTGTSTISTTRNRKSSAGTIIVVILIILAILIAIGFYTGWIQRTTGITL